MAEHDRGRVIIAEEFFTLKHRRKMGRRDQGRGHYRMVSAFIAERTGRAEGYVAAAQRRPDLGFSRQLSCAALKGGTPDVQHIAAAVQNTPNLDEFRSPHWFKIETSACTRHLGQIILGTSTEPRDVATIQNYSIWDERQGLVIVSRVELRRSQSHP